MGSGGDRSGEERRGQSELVGVVLLLAIVVTGTGAVIAIGGDAISETQSATHVQRIEHTMTLFDSHAAMVALGDSNEQVIDLSDGGDGEFAVSNRSGWLRVRHVNYSAGSNETVYNASLGSVVYTNGDTDIAYEGGGVWRTTGNGTVMVSPPEFHYRGATLTLPVVRVNGSDRGVGGLRADVTAERTADRVFPVPDVGPTPGVDEVGAPYDDTGGGSDRRYLNPIHNGTVEVTIHSDHYRGWATYFRERTEGVVSTNASAETATVELIAVGDDGTFTVPNPGEQTIDFVGIGTHSVHDFNVTMYEDEGGSDFNSMKWSMYARNGDRYFEIHMESNAGGNCNPGDAVDVALYYDADVDDGQYQGWQKDAAFDIECPGSGPRYFVANLTGTTNFTYTSPSGMSQWNRAPSGSLNSPVTHDAHAVDNDTQFYTGDQASVGYLVNHYLSLMGANVELEVADKGRGGGGSVDEDASTVDLDYDGSGGQFITYLHVTENRIRVGFR